MPKSFYLSLSVLPLLGLALLALHAVPASPDWTGFAVVELFTSEGCSSCPAADRLLARLDEDARRDGLPVYTLAFHVDYWNHLGWEDPYSRPAFSERQYDYSEGFDESVYTPQMIVNGRRVFVGSHAAAADGFIAEALRGPAGATVTLRTIGATGDRLDVAFTVEGAAAADVLNLALVERDLERAVQSGENRGRTLEHTNVVRAFLTVPARATRAELEVPPGVRLDRASIIGYVQDPETLRIKGAASTAPRP